jgi:hypothetical protein
MIELTSPPLSEILSPVDSVLVSSRSKNVVVSTMTNRESGSRSFRVGPFLGGDGRGVDKENGVIYGVAVAEAVEALGHGIELDDVTLSQIADQINQSRIGIKSRFTHPGLSADGTGKFLGRMKNARLFNDKVIADLHMSESATISPSGDLWSYLLSLAEEDPEALGMSISATGYEAFKLADGREVTEKPADYEGLPVFRIDLLRAVDVVDEPAANRDGLFSSWLEDTNLTAHDLYILLDEQINNLGVDHQRAWEFVLSYFQTRGIEFGIPTGEGIMEDKVKEEVEQATVSSPGSDNTKALLEELSQLRFKNRALELGLDGDTVAEIENLVAATEVGFDKGVSMLEFAARKQAELGEKLANAIKASAQPQPIQPVSGVTPDNDSLKVVEDEHTRFQKHIDWFFGASNTPPPANMRRISELYGWATGDFNWTGAIQDERMFAAATTSTLTAAVTVAINKSMGHWYDGLGEYRWYEPLTKVVAHDGTMNAVKTVFVHGFQDLPIVAEGQAYTEISVDDHIESLTFDKRGQYVGVTLEMIRADDINTLQSIPQRLINSAVKTRSSAVAALFTMNSGVGPTLGYDAKAVFHTDHGNVATTALSDAALKAAAIASFKQTMPGSNARLGLRPRYVLIPVDLWGTALSALGYGEGAGRVGRPTAAGTAQESNILVGTDMWDGDPRPIPIVVPDWTDANDWATLVSPAVHPVIQMAYGNQPGGGSHPMPEIYNAANETSGLMFSNDTMAVKIRDWWGVQLVTHLGVMKRNVT